MCVVCVTQIYENEICYTIIMEFVLHYENENCVTRTDENGITTGKGVHPIILPPAIGK